MTGHLHPDLTALLLRPINQRRVFRKDGQSHLAAWDVRAHLNRCFGFAAWSAETVRAELIHDLETTTKQQKPARKVAYRAQVKLTIHETGATYTEWAVGEAVMPEFKHGDAHDFALKTAESQALKRCAVNLGSQFGLSLYDNGNLDDVVRGVFAVKFADDVEVADEGSEPGLVVDEETGEIHETTGAGEAAPTRAGSEETAPAPVPDPDAGAVEGEAAAPASDLPYDVAGRLAFLRQRMNRPDAAPTKAQTARMWAILGPLGDDDTKREFMRRVITRAWESSKELTAVEVAVISDAAETLLNPPEYDPEAVAS